MIRHTLCSCFTALAFAAAVPAVAQDIAVVTNAYHLIPDGSVTSGDFPSTRFEDTLVGQGDGKQFFILNDSKNAALQIQGMSITGANANVFNLLDPGNPALGYNDTGYITVQFNPPAPGVYTAQINIFSNDPDSEDTYSFAISGVGVQGLPLALPNILPNPDKERFKVGNNGLNTVSGKTVLENYGYAPVNSGTAEIYVTSKRYLDDSATFVYSKKLKKMKARTDEKLYKKKIGWKVKTELSAGSVFVMASPEADEAWGNNLYRFQFTSEPF